ncbi:unnamed protein product [Closterium sp. NIES-53]
MNPRCANILPPRTPSPPVPSPQGLDNPHNPGIPNAVTAFSEGCSEHSGFPQNLEILFRPIYLQFPLPQPPSPPSSPQIFLPTSPILPPYLFGRQTQEGHAMACHGP